MLNAETNLVLEKSVDTTSKLCSSPRLSAAVQCLFFPPPVRRCQRGDGDNKIFDEDLEEVDQMVADAASIPTATNGTTANLMVQAILARNKWR
jgi:hypothetical protein